MTRIPYTEAELTWIRINCKMPRKEAFQRFCYKFNRTDISLDNFVGLRKRKGWLTGRTGQFEKGIIPHNTGKKMPYNANSAKNHFKKGNAPHNTKYVGHERITKKDGYIEINVGAKQTGYKNNYILKHLYLWEQKNGPLPDGMCLKCLDGNRQNTDPSNWEPIPRQALPLLNGHRGYHYEKMPAELKPTVLILARVKCAKSKAIKKGSKA